MNDPQQQEKDRLRKSMIFLGQNQQANTNIVQFRARSPIKRASVKLDHNYSQQLSAYPQQTTLTQNMGNGTTKTQLFGGFTDKSSLISKGRHEDVKTGQTLFHNSKSPQFLSFSHHNIPPQGQKIYNTQTNEGADRDSPLFQDILNTLVEKYLPQMIGKANNEIHELIRGIRLELQDLRKDLQNLEKKQDGFNNISDGKQAKIVMSRPGSITFNLQKNPSEVNQQLILLDNKITQLEFKLGDKLTQLSNELVRLNSRLGLTKETFGLRPSIATSSLPAILLQYRQIFSVRQKEKQEPLQLPISSFVYYIDRQGNLMDSESKYITDQRGVNIRLDEKHIKLLAAHKIIE